MQAVWSFSVSNALWLCTDRGAFDSASAVNLPVQAQYGLPYPWPCTWPFLLTSIMRFCHSLGSGAHMSWSWGVIVWGCISVFLHLSSYASSRLHRRCIWHYWQAEAHMWITSVDFEGLHERSHTAHVFACVLSQISLLVACRSRKLPSGFQLNLLQTLSVCPEGPALMENHQSHTISPVINSCLY